MSSHSQTNQPSLLFGVRRPTTSLHQIFQSLTSSTNYRAVEFVVDVDAFRGLFAYLIRDGKDRRFGSVDGRLCSANLNVSQCVRIICLVNVNLGSSVILDLID